MTDSVSNDRNPTPDVAEDNAFFPSPYSLSQYTSSKTDFAGASYPNAYRGGKWKVLMIASQERYLLMQNGKFFHRQPPGRDAVADVSPGSGRFRDRHRHAVRRSGEAGNVGVPCRGRRSGSRPPSRSTAANQAAEKS